MGFTAFLVIRNYLFISALWLCFFLKLLDRAPLVDAGGTTSEDSLPVCKHSGVCGHVSHRYPLGADQRSVHTNSPNNNKGCGIVSLDDGTTSTVFTWIHLGDSTPPDWCQIPFSCRQPQILILARRRGRASKAAISGPDAAEIKFKQHFCNCDQVVFPDLRAGRCSGITQQITPPRPFPIRPCR